MKNGYFGELNQGIFLHILVILQQMFKTIYIEETSGANLRCDCLSTMASFNHPSSKYQTLYLSLYRINLGLQTDCELY